MQCEVFAQGKKYWLSERGVGPRGWDAASDQAELSACVSVAVPRAYSGRGRERGVTCRSRYTLLFAVRHRMRTCRRHRALHLFTQCAPVTTQIFDVMWKTILGSLSTGVLKLNVQFCVRLNVLSLCQVLYCAFGVIDVSWSFTNSLHVLKCSNTNFGDSQGVSTESWMNASISGAKVREYFNLWIPLGIFTNIGT